MCKADNVDGTSLVTMRYLISQGLLDGSGKYSGGSGVMEKIFRFFTKFLSFLPIPPPSFNSLFTGGKKYVSLIITPVLSSSTVPPALTQLPTHQYTLFLLLRLFD